MVNLRWMGLCGMPFDYTVLWKESLTDGAKETIQNVKPFNLRVIAFGYRRKITSNAKVLEDGLELAMVNIMN